MKYEFSAIEIHILSLIPQTNYQSIDKYCLLLAFISDSVINISTHSSTVAIMSTSPPHTLINIYY